MKVRLRIYSHHTNIRTPVSISVGKSPLRQSGASLGFHLHTQNQRTFSSTLK
jgi:hypothetical protein